MAITTKKISQLTTFPGQLDGTELLELTRLTPTPATSFSISTSQLRNQRSYTVSTLPTPGTAGRQAYASNCRVFNGAGVQEAAGAGTGSLVIDNGAAWKIVGTNVTAVA